MRILYFIRALNIGGAETFIYNVLSQIDSDKFHIDIVLQSKNNTNNKLLKLCKEKKSVLYKICPFYKNYFKSISQLCNILKNGDYDIIHIHANALINMSPIIAAVRTNTRIVLHSHNTNNNLGGKLGKLLHRFNVSLLNKKNIIRFACSQEAGEWMFGNSPFTVLNNAINLTEYSYNKSKRDYLRENLRVENDYVIGHVGRFVRAKNHDFLIDIFCEVLKLREDAKLILLGDGELYDNINDKVKSKNIVDKVIFCGLLENTADYYSAFDCMIFPSIFEGLPFTLVEAQASGLKIYASTAITQKVNVTKTIEYISLDKNASYWANKIVKKVHCCDRNEVGRCMQGSIFDSCSEIRKLEHAYNSSIRT